MKTGSGGFLLAFPGDGDAQRDDEPHQAGHRVEIHRGGAFIQTV